MIRKKGQNEIVGFVLIMVIVAVIGVVFLGISLRSKREIAIKDIEVNYFLQAVMQYTTDCAISFEPDYDSVQDLIGSCYKDRKCLDGRRACDVLDSVLSDIMGGEWVVGEDRAVKAYDMEINYKLPDGVQEILKLSDGNFGNCSIMREGEHIQNAFNGDIATTLKLCYSV